MDQVFIKIGNANLLKVNCKHFFPTIFLALDLDNEKIKPLKIDFSSKVLPSLNISNNPWNVSSVSDFLNYNCPECEFKSIELDGFCQHATEKHELSKILFGDKINSDITDIKIEPAIEMYDNNDDIANEDDIKSEFPYEEELEEDDDILDEDYEVKKTYSKKLKKLKKLEGCPNSIFYKKLMHSMLR